MCIGEVDCTPVHIWFRAERQDCTDKCILNADDPTLASGICKDQSRQRDRRHRMGVIMSCLTGVRPLDLLSLRGMSHSCLLFGSLPIATAGVHGLGAFHGEVRSPLLPLRGDGPWSNSAAPGLEPLVTRSRYAVLGQSRQVDNLC